MMIRAATVRAVAMPKNDRVATIPHKRQGHVYLRVDTRADEPKLWNRIERMRTTFPEHEVIADVGSGYDYRRAGLIKLMRRVVDRQVSEIVVTDESQLSTLTYNHISSVCAFYKTRIRFHALPEENEQTS